MKTKIKIAVIAMMGICLGVKAQNESINGSLQIKDRLTIYNSDNDQVLHLRPNSGNSGYIYWAEGGVAERGILGFEKGSKDLVYASGGFNFDNSIERFRIKYNGHVGIGTSNPIRSLHVLSNQWDNSSGSGVIFENGNSVGSGITLKPTASQVTNGNLGWAIYAGGPSSVVKDGNLGFWSHGTNKVVMSVNRSGVVGIGTTSPSEKLEIVDSNASLRIRSTNLANNSSLKLDWGINHGYHISYNPNSAVTYFDSKHNAISNTPYGDVLFRRNVNNVMKETFVIKGNSGNVGIGTINPGVWKLAVNGNIRAKEIKVETGWSDFVFYEDYKLPTLEEVENHIKEKGHLKDIPSAKEVANNGIFLGEMDSKLLQKIEEINIIYN